MKDLINKKITSNILNVIFILTLNIAINKNVLAQATSLAPSSDDSFALAESSIQLAANKTLYQLQFADEDQSIVESKNFLERVIGTIQDFSQLRKQPQSKDHRFESDLVTLYTKASHALSYPQWISLKSALEGEARHLTLQNSQQSTNENFILGDDALTDKNSLEIQRIHDSLLTLGRIVNTIPQNQQNLAAIDAAEIIIQRQNTSLSIPSSQDNLSTTSRNTDSDNFMRPTQVNAQISSGTTSLQVK